MCSVHGSAANKRRESFNRLVCATEWQAHDGRAHRREFIDVACLSGTVVKTTEVNAMMRGQMTQRVPCSPVFALRRRARDAVREKKEVTHRLMSSEALRFACTGCKTLNYRGDSINAALRIDPISGRIHLEF